MQVKISLPGQVQEILDKLQEAGFEAYAVGGCVRDSLLGREPEDWDVTTSALPEEIKKIFTKTVDTGIQHGTVTVIMKHAGYEVTTYRIDGEYEDGRHPKEVSFTASLKEDLKRRDFTINAMAYNAEQGLVDVFGGVKDLEKGIIRCVGRAEERFQEDALRMMRAVRFSAQLGYAIEKETREGIKKLASNLAKVSAERIQTELIKLLCSPNPERLRDAWETGLTKVFLPELDRAMETAQNHPHHCYTVGEHILHSLAGVEPDKILRLTMLLHDIGKPMVKTVDEEGTDHFYGHAQVGERMAEEILRRLRMDNDTIKRVCLLVRYHDWRPKADKTTVRRGMVRLSPELFPFYLKVQYADILAQSAYLRQEKLDRLREVEEVYQEILAQNECFRLKDMAVGGRELLELGMCPGPQLGELLNRLFSHVLERPEDNKKEVLIELAQKWKEV